MPSKALISLTPNGVVPTLSTLRSVDVSTIGENACVTVLGSGTANDGFGGNYYFAAGSTATDDGGNNAIATSTTGRWLKAPSVGAYTGVGPVATTLPNATAASSYVGSRESFVLISGAANTTVYTLPPSVISNGNVIRFKQIGTGAYTIRAAAGDSIFDGTGLAVIIPSNALRTGQSYTLQCHGSVYYTI